MRVRLSAQAFSTIQGSELYYDAGRYDGGSEGAQDARAGLRAATGRRVGKGYSYLVDTTRAGAETILDYCETVGSTFASPVNEAETRAEGRALLRVAARIRGQFDEMEGT